MGFNIGRFIGGALSGALGGISRGSPVEAIVGGVGGGLEAGFAADARVSQAATVGRATQPGPITAASINQGLQFGGGGRFLPSSVGPVTLALGSLRGFGRGGTALIPFGNGNGNGNPIQLILRKAREATGGPVTRNRIIDAAKACGLETTASTFGIDLREVCLVIVKGRTRRRRGVSAADIRRTKRTINFASKVRKDLKALAR